MGRMTGTSCSGQSGGGGRQHGSVERGLGKGPVTFLFTQYLCFFSFYCFSLVTIRPLLLSLVFSFLAIVKACIMRPDGIRWVYTSTHTLLHFYTTLQLFIHTTRRFRPTDRPTDTSSNPGTLRILGYRQKDDCSGCYDYYYYYYYHSLTYITYSPTTPLLLPPLLPPNPSIKLHQLDLAYATSLSLLV
ncbi:uncharacterized protein J3D65DRAFT_175278 [Phyllosticta citribraziliensis]|uniref:Uncharacterized protein n=1 Tax=Phyllosticta citribraziliensis TaxID=989973 RepID=A0ABR1L5X0_9PEZI